MKFVLEMSQKIRVLEKAVDRGTLFMVFEVADFLVAIDLLENRDTMEKTDEKRRLTVERL